MNHAFNLGRIQRAIDSLKPLLCNDAEAIKHLKALAMQNNGRWDLPHEGCGYNPVIKSIEVFGVHAMASEVEELPKNWLIAAENILSLEEDEA